jgi:hypothetical protein
MHVRLIVHGKAAGRPELREAVASARAKGHKIQVQPTWEAGDATRLAQRAVLDEADVVVAGGGDGTINEVAFGLVSANAGPSGRPSLGILPRARPTTSPGPPAFPSTSWQRLTSPSLGRQLRSTLDALATGCSSASRPEDSGRKSPSRRPSP